MPIQFGVPSAMSTHGGSSNSKGECKECVKMYRKGHVNAQKPKYCPRHQCDRTDAAGIMCTKRKRADDPHCQKHTQCTVPDCHDPRAGVFSEHCENHTCIVESCDEGRTYDPTRRIYDDLCATHLSKVCKIPNCIDWQFEDGGNYCMQHTCENCNEKNFVNEGGRPFCIEHNKCIIERCQRPRCQFGNEFESVCREHYIPPCRLESCNQQSSSLTRYCDLHSCRYASRERCKNEARPGRGKPFCIDHKCSDIDCQSLRSFSEIEGDLRMNSFCLEHECKDKTCVKHTILGKPFCNSHCCTDSGCTEARDGNPRLGTLCFVHHEKRIASRAKDEQLEEIRRKEAQQAANERADRAEKARRLREEEARRQAPRREDDRRERREQPYDGGRRPDLPKRPARSPHQYGGQEGLRPRPRQRFDDEYADEGYRSNRSSGDSFGAYGGR